MMSSPSRLLNTNKIYCKINRLCFAGALIIEQAPIAFENCFAYEKHLPFNLRYYQKICEYTSNINAGKTALFFICWMSWVN